MNINKKANGVNSYNIKRGRTYPFESFSSLPAIAPRLDSFLLFLVYVDLPLNEGLEETNFDLLFFFVNHVSIVKSFVCYSQSAQE